MNVLLINSTKKVETYAETRLQLQPQKLEAVENHVQTPVHGISGKLTVSIFPQGSFRFLRRCVEKQWLQLLPLGDGRATVNEAAVSRHSVKCRI